MISLTAAYRLYKLPYAATCFVRAAPASSLSVFGIIATIRMKCGSRRGSSSGFALTAFSVCGAHDRRRSNAA
jgi:hypothetical protein